MPTADQLTRPLDTAYIRVRDALFADTRAVSVRQLAKVVGNSPRHVCRIVKRLECAGLAKTRKDKKQGKSLKVKAVIQKV